MAAAVALAALVAPEAHAAGILWRSPPPQGRTFVVYAFTEGNSAYVGRASREGDRSFQSVMSRRYSSGMRPGWSNQARMLWLEYYSGNVPARSGPAYQEARRMEQDFMDRFRSSGYNLTNRVRATAKPKPAPRPRPAPRPPAGGGGDGLECVMHPQSGLRIMCPNGQ